MRIAMGLAMSALAATMAGCATSPVDYGASLSQQDQKWATPQCQQARAAASDYAVREKTHPGWEFVALGPYGLGIIAATKEQEQKQRKRLARDVHLQCSSLPLPQELQGDLGPAGPDKAKYP
ncbi:MULTISPECIES: hypothetical protein [unclassified Mesorhizobium]|uniref:hypothetical protein n=2 Tax=unclassified Mesorhizobium TaxID=325217 RepID=UPI000FC99AD3|nr:MULTISPECIES: hypothetical protein [unclassified Mesorhizobium]RUX03620.1 hypothetical protein EOA35_11945 [Mesorhizobium sp. M8A.F.Ca.ET.023.01.1.1]RUX04655.1 hypothetical protein EOA30_13805 [Mesorhizobium sp. M8A.F.Ca.ET.059.01.1.1]RVD59532.1 hypothetical protein EN746_02485 [Mesorhizobium sp. M8A.F.Ca.ET.023.02.2.1]TGV08568.1 hypothetical protein EN816_33070 [Mesorhizobium sp. M8A.F.Ca.ET.173.01.1.1]TGV55865.1 hypothetical protein EN784_29620 [bacterium M00.F.Ca.ET.141.01.1.1]